MLAETIAVKKPVNQALTAFLLLCAAGMISALVGVFILAGAGWMALVFAAECFAAAAFVQRGMTITGQHETT